VVEEQLSEVQPMLDAARAAVGSIKADNINEIRSLRMAPDAIRDVLEGVMLLMGQEDTSWSNMKTFLGKKSVKDDLINYDAHRWGHHARSVNAGGMGILVALCGGCA
jgi:dynein heavy chain 2